MGKDLSKLSRYSLLLLAFIGIVISVELCFIYFNANFNPAAGPSFCAVNEVVDCDAVSETSYSRILGVPLSLWGLGFYGFIFLLTLFPKRLKNYKSYIFSLASFAVGFSIILAYISSFVLEKICILCHALYLVNFLLFILCLIGDSAKDLYKNTFEDIKSLLNNKLVLIGGSVLAIIGTVVLLVINIYQPFVPKMQDIKPQAKIENIGNILGAENPKLTIMEFTDYECPFCSVSNRMMIRLATEVEGVRIEHYDFPLNAECNPLVEVSIHDNSCTAIYYARAAKRQGKFWDLSTLMFDNQENLSEKNILKLAEVAGLDIEQLKKDAKDPKIKEGIKEDIEKAKALGIMGTPTYIIGIKKYEGAIPYQRLKAIIQESL